MLNKLYFYIEYPCHFEEQLSMSLSQALHVNSFCSFKNVEFKSSIMCVVYKLNAFSIALNSVVLISQCDVSVVFFVLHLFFQYVHIV